MLTGLLIANRETRDGRALAGALAVAGTTLLETTARRLMAVGVGRMLLVVERPDATIADAVVRLGRDGLSVTIVANAAEIAGQTTASERLLLVADGALIDEDSLRLLVTATAPAALTIADLPANAAWERIDADRRWGGAALIDGETLARVAALPAEWDLGSTLLRSLLQAGGTLLAGAPGGLLALVEDEDDADALTAALGERAADAARGPADRWLLLPLARLLATAAMEARAAPDALAWTAAGAAILAAPVASAGMVAAALALVLLSGAIAAIARRVALISWRPTLTVPAERLRIAALTLTLLVGAVAVQGETGDSGAPALAGATLAFLIVAARQEQLFGSEQAPWRADPDSLAWLLLPFALGGWWRLGLLVLAFVTLLHLLTVQRRSARPC